MGGDLAPREIVRGALWAAGALRDVEVILVGNQSDVRAELDRCGGAGRSVSVRHASQAVKMSESPVEALRKKGDSSIGAAVELVAGMRKEQEGGAYAVSSESMAVGGGSITYLPKTLPPHIRHMVAPYRWKGLF